MLSYSKYIIDAHAHIFPDKIAQKATDNIGRFYDLYMNFDGTADSLINQGSECGVSKYVVQSVATVPHQVKRINDFIVQSVAKYPDKLIGFGSLHPDMKGMEEEIDRLISLGLHGIKLHPILRILLSMMRKPATFMTQWEISSHFLFIRVISDINSQIHRLWLRQQRNILIHALLPLISEDGLSGKRQSMSLWDLIIYG